MAGSLVKKTPLTTINSHLLLHPGKQDVAPSRFCSNKAWKADQLWSGHHDLTYFTPRPFFFFFWTFSLDYDEHRPICLDLFCHTSCSPLCSDTAAYGSKANGAVIVEKNVEGNKVEPTVLTGALGLSLALQELQRGWAASSTNQFVRD